MPKNPTASVLVAALLLLAAAPGTAAELATVESAGTTVTFMPRLSSYGWLLRVSAPDGQVYTQEFAGKEIPSFVTVDDRGALMPDGSYVWELIALPAPRSRDRGGATLKTNSQTGAFSLQGGALVAGDAVEAVPTKDFVVNDDVITVGSLCVGFDCTNGEVFDFDTIRLKENNLRIHFLDTSGGSFPTTDWRITINDSNSGGVGRFSIDDASAGRTPFTIRANAPNNALFVDAAGRIGIGTATPVLNVHIATGNTPALRLEQNNSSGFTPQTWDLAGNEANFFVRDVTAGSRLPLRIVPNAPSNSVFIAGTSGDVGMGTSAPSEELHIRRTDAGPTRFLVENTTAGLTGYTLKNTLEEWRIVNDGRYVMNSVSGAGNEFILTANGALTLTGAVKPNLNTGGGAGTAVSLCTDSGGFLCRCGQCG